MPFGQGSTLSKKIIGVEYDYQTWKECVEGWI
jgi:hypothetical protein